MKRLPLALVAPAVAAALLWVACETPLSPGYQLTNARILAIQSEPVDLVPDSSVSLNALLYLPPGSPPPTYQWSWCAAVGGTLQCSVDAGALTQILDQDGSFAVNINYSLGSGAQAVFPFPVDPAVLQSACVRSAPEGGADGAADAEEAGDEAGAADLGDGGVPVVGIGHLACNSTSWTIYVLLTVGTGTTSLQATRSITAYLAPPASTNTNPTILGIAPFTSPPVDAGPLVDPGAQADGSLVEPAVGSQGDAGIVIAAQIPLAATDLYTVTPFAAAAGPDASDAAPPLCPADAGGLVSFDAGCLRQVYESLTLSWYVQGGQLEHATTSMPSVRLGSPQDWGALLVNQWAAPAPQGTTQFILVARDDRGGVGWAQLPVQLPLP